MSVLYTNLNLNIPSYYKKPNDISPSSPVHSELLLLEASYWVILLSTQVTQSDF